MRVLLADDHTLVRAGIRALLRGLGGVEVVAEAGDGREAVALVERLKPDVAILDITMPGLNGIDAASHIAAVSPRTRTVVLSMHSSECFVVQALRAGVSAYVPKDACVEELPVLFRALMRGETYLSPGISKRVLDALLGRGGTPDPGAFPADVLTPRQREILQLWAEGCSTKEIAQRLVLSVKTVETHRTQIMDRLDIHDVPGLVRYAIRAGLVSIEC